MNFHGQRLNVVALPPGDLPVEVLAERMAEEKPKQTDEIDGQTDIFDFIN